LEALEQQASKDGTPCKRFDKIVTNYADHISFLRAGLSDAFSVTSISPKDIEVAYHYYKAQEFDVDKETLHEIMRQAPIFQHYHQPTDLSSHLSEASLQRVCRIVWNTLVAIDTAP
jgi:hypothetical protein